MRDAAELDVPAPFAWLAFGSQARAEGEKAVAVGRAGSTVTNRVTKALSR